LALLRTTDHLASDQELAEFLKDVQRRAFRRTVFSVRNEDAALDIVQDAMIRLAQRYAQRPSDELPLLFQRILVNATMDWFRRQKVRDAVISPLSDLDRTDDSLGADAPGGVETDRDDPWTHGADHAVMRQELLLLIEGEIAALPSRQREAFLLRYWEEFDVNETAQIMGCSEGSVKTHCSRAVQSLAKSLKSKGISL